MTGQSTLNAVNLYIIAGSVTYIVLQKLSTCKSEGELSKYEVPSAGRMPCQTTKVYRVENATNYITTYWLRESVLESWDTSYQE